MRVLGVDIGYSVRRRTTGVAALAVEGRGLRLACLRCTSRREDLAATAARAVAGEAGGAAAIAIDGPLLPGLRRPSGPRVCEKLLSWGALGCRCRPGEVTAPVGRRLAGAARVAARMFAATVPPPALPARRFLPLSDCGVCEAFPTAFMAVLVPGEQFQGYSAVGRGRKTDWLYRRLVAGQVLGGLAAALVGTSLAGALVGSLAAVGNHDERAAAICALTALCLARGRFTAIGDADGGYIILPPWEHWQPWARAAVEDNVERARRIFGRGEVAAVGS